MAATGILVIGPSGVGKSTSMRNLDPKSTYLINVQGKPLPFKKGKEYKKVTPGDNPGTGNQYCTDDAETIVAVMEHISNEMPHIKTIVLDDWQYAMTNEFMRKADVKGYQKFTDIATHIWMVANAPSKLRDDLVVVMLAHDEEIVDSQGVRRKKARTIGKLVDEKIVLEGMFTIVLYADARTVTEAGTKKIKNVFVTQNAGDTTAKSPMGMFEELEVENDLVKVISKVNDYYGS